FGIAAAVELGAAPLQNRARLPVARRNIGEQLASLACLQIDVLSRLALQQKIAPPACERVRPGFDGEHVAGGDVGHETRRPAIVLVQAHRPAVPALVALAPPYERGRDDVVAVTKYVRPDVDGLPGDALHRIAALLERRVDLFDDKPRAQEVARGSRSRGDRRESGLGGHDLIWIAGWATQH